MINLSKSTRWIGAGSLAVATVVALAISAQGATTHTATPPPKPPPNSCTQTWNPQLNTFNAPVMLPGHTDTQNCFNNLAGHPLWAPSAGVVNGMMNGKQYTGHGDAVRVATTGQIRLYRSDPTYVETGNDAAEVAAQKQYGGPLLLGSIEVAPAPKSENPPKPGDNSLGWANATGTKLYAAPVAMSTVPALSTPAVTNSNATATNG